DAAVLRRHLELGERRRLTETRLSQYARRVEVLGVERDAARRAERGRGRGVERGFGDCLYVSHRLNRSDPLFHRYGQTIVCPTLLSPPRPASCALRPSGGRAGAAEHFVAVQRNVQLALEIGLLGHLHPDHRARLEGDRAREIAERAVAVRGTQARRVEQRLALKLAPGTVVEERVQELNL